MQTTKVLAIEQYEWTITFGEHLRILKETNVAYLRILCLYSFYVAEEIHEARRSQLARELRSFSTNV
jgi:hypothetical protein